MAVHMRRVKRATLGLLLTAAFAAPVAARADTVASLSGQFHHQSILRPAGREHELVEVHYVVVFGQLPALRELHSADADGDGVTSQAERDAYVGRLAPVFAQRLEPEGRWVKVPLQRPIGPAVCRPSKGASLYASMWTCRCIAGTVPGSSRTLDFTNQNYAGRMGWHEIVVKPASGLFRYSIPMHTARLDRRSYRSVAVASRRRSARRATVHLSFGKGAPPGAELLRAAK